MYFMPLMSRTFRPTGHYGSLKEPQTKPFTLTAAALTAHYFAKLARSALDLLGEIPLPKPTYGHLDEEAEQKREVEAVTAPLPASLAPPEVTPGAADAAPSGGAVGSQDDDQNSSDPTAEDLSPWRSRNRSDWFHPIDRRYIKTRFGTFQVS